MKMAHETDRWKTKRLDALKIDSEQLASSKEASSPFSIHSILKARRRYSWLMPVAIMIVILMGLVLAWILRKP